MDYKWNKWKTLKNIKQNVYIERKNNTIQYESMY